LNFCLIFEAEFLGFTDILVPLFVPLYSTKKISTTIGASLETVVLRKNFMPWVVNQLKTIYMKI